MPAVGVGMTDQEVADVTDYVRNTWGNADPKATGAGLVAGLRASTQTLLTGDPNGCPTRGDSAAAGLLDEASADTLRQSTPDGMSEALDLLMPKVKEIASSHGVDDTVNSLTAAYCRVLAADSQLSQSDRQVQLGNFGMLVYSRLKAQARG